jgi:hypothetical protein
VDIQPIIRYHIELLTLTLLSAVNVNAAWLPVALGFLK